MVEPTSRARTRIGYVVPPSGSFAGIERVVHEIADGIARTHPDEFDVHVAFAERYEHPDLDDAAYHTHILGAERLLKLPLLVRAWARTEQLDLVVCAQVETTVLTWLALRGTGISRVIAHLHGNPKIERAAGTLRTRLAYQLFTAIVAPRLVGVVAVAPELRDYVVRELAPQTPAYYAKNPLRAISDPTRAPQTDTFRFVTVARLARQKGIDVLLDAIARARPYLPPFAVVLVGDGPDRTTLEERVHRMGLRDVVQFVGAVDDPSSYVRGADCFVLPSRWEGFPLVLLEALATGVPVLATRCEFGPADLVDDQRLGELVAVDDADALAVGLLRAATWRRDPDEEETRRRVAAQYARPEAVASHAEVFRAIVRGQHA